MYTQLGLQNIIYNYGLTRNQPMKLGTHVYAQPKVYLNYTLVCRTKKKKKKKNK